MKRILSFLLVLTMLCGSVCLFSSCKNGSKETEAPTLSYDKNVLVDFSNASAISECGLTAKTGDVKTASNAGEWNLGSTKKVEMKISGADVSSFKEICVWINNTAESDVKIALMLSSDNLSTPETDGYQTYLNVHPGWHNYAVPVSEMTEIGTPNGYEGVTAVVLDTTGLSISGSPVLLIDSVYGGKQKYGTTKGFQYSDLAKAVCFYEDGYTYLYDQLRYVFKEGDRFVTVTNDGKTAYVPVSVLAEHRGATEISASAEKVSFKYNGQTYEYTPETEITFTGDAQGVAPGREFTVKPVVSGDYIMIPMETCRDIFGYQLFYSQMGLIIFSDIKNIYNDEYDFEELYDICEVIVWETYTGSELVENMNELYGEDGHGKLILNQAQIDHLKGLLKTDPIYASWFQRYEADYAKGSKNYTGQQYKFDLADGYRLLGMSRDVMNAIINYAFLYRMTGNEDYGKKVYDVMNAASKFKDPVTGANSWHPEHYLDCGEICFGFAIGYDWCYDYFDDKQRSNLEEAVWEMGYGAALGFGDVAKWWSDPTNLEEYNEGLAADGKNPYSGYTLGNDLAPYNDGTYGGRKFEFNRSNWTNNWNAVCNGGIGTMALAFANVNETFREKSEYLLDCIMYTLPFSLKPSYAPDGGYPEGPGYWSYGTTYSINLFSSLLSATGTDMGLINVPGFRESFYFINSFATFDGGVWNYHDAGEGAIPGKPDMQFSFWFAANTGDTNMAKRRYDMINGDYTTLNLWDLMWYDASALEGECELALDAVYYGIDTCTFRSGWDEGSLFCGLHGGAANASHGQLDNGNFILEVNGVRFFRDLGADEYNLTGNFGNPKIPEYTVKYFTNPYRYWYYRMRAEGHNTLVINPSKVDVTNLVTGTQGRNYDQILTANSEILRYESGESSACAVVDMGVAYLDAREGKRGMLVTDDRTTVIIQDEMTLSGPATKVYWFGNLALESKVTLADDKKSAIIEKDGVRLLCEIVVPEGYKGDFKFDVMAADYLQETGLSTIKGEVSREGFMKLAAVGSGMTEIKLAVVCRLLSDGPSGYEWTPIDEWVVE